LKELAGMFIGNLYKYYGFGLEIVGVKKLLICSGVKPVNVA
jgi:hypothetical protein